MSSSAGTFIGAAFATAGQYYQSYAIDLLTYPLQGFIVLAFVIGCLATLAAYAFKGGIQGGALIFLGPILFIAVVMQRSDAPPVAWTAASTDQEQKSVSDTVSKIVEEKKYQPRVSSVFSAFDGLVSKFVQQTSNGLRASDAKVDMGLVVRSQLLGFLMSPEVSDPGLKELIHLSLLGECRGMIQAGQEMADKRNRSAERCEWAKTYSELASKTTFKLTPNASKYLASLLIDVPMLLDTPVVADLGQEMGDFQTQLAADQAAKKPAEAPITCSVDGTKSDTLPDAAALSEDAIKQDAYVRNQILKTVGGTTDGLPRSSDSVEALGAYFADRDEKVAAKVQELSGISFSCHELWNVVYVALHYESAKSLETVKNEGTDRGLDPQQLVDDLAQMSGVEGNLELIKAISRKLFRIENISGSSSAIVQEYAARGPEIRSIQVMSTSDINLNIKNATQNSEWTGQASMIQTAYMLPYYQGLLLFFLAIAFPFFAVLLAIPGRAMGFGLWFGLWFWVKSWDIGYALVSMVDRALYALFVVKMDSGYVTSRTTLDLDFSSAVSALRDVDPTFDVGTYYNIIAVCLLAVPVVSAQLIVQVSAGLASVVRGQLISAQSQAIKSATDLNSTRALGSSQIGSASAKIVREISSLAPLPRNTSVTTISNPTESAILPRKPNLISTGSKPSVVSARAEARKNLVGPDKIAAKASVSRLTMLGLKRQKTISDSSQLVVATDAEKNNNSQKSVDIVKNASVIKQGGTDPRIKK